MGSGPPGAQPSPCRAHAWAVGPRGARRPGNSRDPLPPPRPRREMCGSFPPGLCRPCCSPRQMFPKPKFPAHRHQLLAVESVSQGAARMAPGCVTRGRRCRFAHLCSGYEPAVGQAGAGGWSDVARHFGDETPSFRVIPSGGWSPPVGAPPWGLVLAGPASVAGSGSVLGWDPLLAFRFPCPFSRHRQTVVLDI